MDMAILPFGTLIEHSSWEMGWPKIISSPLVVGRALIAGMRSGDMATGNFRPVRVLFNSSS